MSHCQCAFANVGCNESVDGAVLGVAGRQPLHLVAVDSPEDQDSHRRKDNEDNHRSHDYDGQHHYAIVRTLDHCEREKEQF